MNSNKGVVYVVEDDASCRLSIVCILRRAGLEVETFESANDFLDNAMIRYPGCLLLDVMLPDVDGLSLQSVLSKNDSHLPIVFMSGHGSISMSVKAMKRGAVNFLSKPFTREELLSAINEALELSVKDMKETFEKDHINARIKTLTPREKEVMRWVISGRLNKQIAWELGTVEKTIKVHRSRIMQKTGADSVAELVRMTEKIGILPVD